MPQDVQARIHALIGEYVGVGPEKLQAQARLSFDLGMEGIDAEEFFDRYSIEFSVDIDDLKSNWNTYFSSENTSLVIVLAWAISAVLLRFAFNFFLPAWPTWICWILAFAIPSVGLYAWTRLTIGPSDNEITIRQLVEAAECGRLKLTPSLRKPKKVVP